MRPSRNRVVELASLKPLTLAPPFNEFMSENPPAPDATTPLLLLLLSEVWLELGIMAYCFLNRGVVNDKRGMKIIGGAIAIGDTIPK